MAAKTDRRKMPKRAKLNDSSEVVVPSFDHLSIMKEGLDKVRRKVPKTSRPKPLVAEVLVRRTRKKEKKCISYAVLKRANENFNLQSVDAINYAGPRFDSNGTFISHSILGSLDDFKKEAQEKGEFKELYQASSIKIPATKQTETPCSSLKVWKDRVKEWNSMHRFLVKKVKKPLEDLLMITPSEQVEIVNQRRMINMALEARASGYGQKRKNASFFKLCENIGGSETPVFYSFNKSITGDRTSAEITGNTYITDQEKGTCSTVRRSYPVYHTPYLQAKILDVQEHINMLVPHYPVLKDLQIVGEVTPMKKQHATTNSSHEADLRPSITVHFPDICRDSESKRSHTLNGPAIKIENQVSKWKGHGFSRKGKPGITVSVLFDGFQTETLHQTLRIENTGSTSLVYVWKKIPAKFLSEIPRPKAQRFFFLSESGVLAPGEILVLPVICKSSTVGFFCETWVIETKPVLDLGADIIVKFKAVVHSRENYMGDFVKTEEKLLQNKAKTIVSDILDRLVESICSPDPPSSPTEELSPEKQFKFENPGLSYHGSTMRKMERYHDFLMDNVSIIPATYKNFSVVNLRRAVIIMTDLEEDELEDPSPLTAEMDEDWDYTKRRLLWRYLRQINSLCCTWPEPAVDLTTSKYLCCSSLLASAFDRFCDLSTQIAISMNLPLQNTKEEITVNHNDKKRTSSQGDSKVGIQTASSKSRHRKSTHMQPSEDVLKSFCPVNKQSVEEGKYDGYQGKLYQMMYAQLILALDKIAVICDEKS